MKSLSESDSRVSGECRFLPLWLAGLWVASLLGIAVLSAACLYFGELNQDEGWYLYAARLVSGGKLPYIDFCFTQGPVMVFVYSLAQPLVDKWGLAGGRLFSVLLNMLCLVSAAWLALRLSAPRGKPVMANRRVCAALLAVMLIGLNVYQVYFSSIVKTYSLTALLLVAGFLALSFVSGRGSAGAAFFAGGLFALAAGTRSSVVVVIPVVFISLLWALFYARRISLKDYEPHDGREEAVPAHIITPILPYARVPVVLAFFAGSVLVLGVVFVPLALKAPESFMFGMIDYHAARGSGDMMMTLVLKAGSILRLCGSYFVPLTLAVMTCLHVLFHRTSFSAAGTTGKFFLLNVVLLSGMAVWVVQLLAPFPYDEYQVNVFPLFAVGLAVYLARVVSIVDLVHVCTGLLLLSVVSSGSSSLVQGWFVRDVDRLWVRVREKPQLVVLRHIGRNIRDAAGSNDVLLTQDAYLAVESGMTLPRGMEMGPFSYVPDWSRERAEACHLLNREMMLEAIEGCGAQVAAFSGYGFAVRSPEVDELSREERDFLISVLEKHYIPFREKEPFGQADTKLRIYLKKDSR